MQPFTRASSWNICRIDLYRTATVPYKNVYIGKCNKGDEWNISRKRQMPMPEVAKYNEIATQKWQKDQGHDIKLYYPVWFNKIMKTGKWKSRQNSL